jgi:lipoate-protein ligase A
MIKTAGERVTSINRFLKREASFEELKKALVDGFEESFKIKLVPGEILTSEKRLAAKLKAEKYFTKEWNFKR